MIENIEILLVRNRGFWRDAAGFRAVEDLIIFNCEGTKRVALENIFIDIDQ